MVGAGHTQAGDGHTYEMIPNAWYSFTALRLIRPRRPCCIPRLKRTTATLGDGCERERDA